MTDAREVGMGYEKGTSDSTIEARMVLHPSVASLGVLSCVGRVHFLLCWCRTGAVLVPC